MTMISWLSPLLVFALRGVHTRRAEASDFPGSGSTADLDPTTTTTGMETTTTGMETDTKPEDGFTYVGEGTLLSESGEYFRTAQFKNLGSSVPDVQGRLEAECKQLAACVGYHVKPSGEQSLEGALLLDASMTWPMQTPQSFQDAGAKKTWFGFGKSTEMGPGLTASVAGGMGWNGWQAYKRDSYTGTLYSFLFRQMREVTSEGTGTSPLHEAKSLSSETSWDLTRSAMRYGLPAQWVSMDSLNDAKYGHFRAEMIVFLEGGSIGTVDVEAGDVTFSFELEAWSWCGGHDGTACMTVDDAGNPVAAVGDAVELEMELSAQGVTPQLTKVSNRKYKLGDAHIILPDTVGVDNVNHVSLASAKAGDSTILLSFRFPRVALSQAAQSAAPADAPVKVIPPSSSGGVQPTDKVRVAMTILLGIFISAGLIQ